MNEKKANGRALLPILVFLVLYLGTGIWYEYIRPVVVAFGIALIVAMLQNRSLSFDEKIHVCAQGIGDDNITTMLFIFLMAGAFSGIAKQAGGAVSTANMLLAILPGNFAVPGLFLIACLPSGDSAMLIGPRTSYNNAHAIPPIFADSSVIASVLLLSASVICFSSSL